MKKIVISSRGTGKVNEKGEVVEFNVISFDFASLYPSTMVKNSDEFKKILLRLERKKKLEQLKEISDDEISGS